MTKARRQVLCLNEKELAIWIIFMAKRLGMTQSAAEMLQMTKTQKQSTLQVSGSEGSAIDLRPH